MTDLDSPRSPNDDNVGTPRNPWLAALLGFFFGPLALVYCGRLARASFWLVACIAMEFLGYAHMLYWAASPAGMLLGFTVMMAPQLVLIVDAIRIARHGQPNGLRPYQRWWIYVVFGIGWICWGVFITSLVPATWVEACVMPTRSMQNTLLPGDCILVDRLSPHLHALHYGDVIAHYENASSSALYVRRVVGLPGDILELKDEKLFRNGEPVEEPYVILEGKIPSIPGMRDFGPHTVGPKGIFLLGDNRRLSRDSRFDGDYSLTSVEGVARVIYWSRAYSETPPVNPRKNRNPTIEWGPIRWSRIGQRLD